MKRILVCLVSLVCVVCILSLSYESYRGGGRHGVRREDRREEDREEGRDLFTPEEIRALTSRSFNCAVCQPCMNEVKACHSLCATCRSMCPVRQCDKIIK